MSNPLITVIVTNYNHANYIQQAVASIEAQTYKNIEVIIVDDCSTDDSEVDLHDFEGRGHKVIRLPENKGKWNALNTACEAAHGTLVTLQDADDASCEQRLEWQLECLQSNKSFHNLCTFTHCWNQEDMDRALSQTFRKNSLQDQPEFLNHAEVLSRVHKGWKTAGINHYSLRNIEAHGASSLFYRQHWEMGMKFLPGNMGLRVQVAEDSDHNTRMTLLLQKTSVLLTPVYCYRRGTSTNGAYMERL